MTPEQVVARHWLWFAIVGGVLAALGLVGLLLETELFTKVAVLYIGLLLIAGGIAVAVKSYLAQQWSGFLLHAVIALLYLVAGVYMLFAPEKASVALTLLLGVILVFAGIARLVFGFLLRDRLGGWFSVILSGVLSLALGLLILFRWPESSVWVIGLFVAIDLTLNGLSLIALSLMLKDVDPEELDEQPAPSA